ncbi:MAG: 2-oxoacid:acceptor oxidoreductase subunit alpha [Chlorobiaceae bacterium]|nr:2-oxoacid:acceptor oxidoreductase subunit alpha [Chlorobiaceae bacterium]
MADEIADLTLVFEGEAGQGIQTVSAIMLPVLKENGYQVFCCSEYMSRIRGGSNTTEIRITSKKRAAYVSRIDVLIAMSPSGFDRLHDRIRPETLVLAERDRMTGTWPVNGVDMPVSRLAAEAGGAMYASTVVVGAAFSLLGLPEDKVADCLEKQFRDKGGDIVRHNQRAAGLGYAFVSQLSAALRPPHPGPASEGAGRETLLMDGTSALGIGSVMAGCNFISSYPMSPGTGLLTFLAGHAKEFGIVVDQAEDEIAAINAALGASYAGARAVVTTSGGGFDLMQEGVSLAGMIETPIVIHIGQRPGPATGLPTRTEQGDLALVLHAGHGDFARAVFAPGTLAEIVECTQRAFNLAQRFQIPVFILTDQYLLDAVSTIDEAELHQLSVEQGIVETDPDYQRYRLTTDGLSPRGVPGFGNGIVRVDSDEHDGSGVITESFEMRRFMVEKRLKRLRPLRETALPATPSGAIDTARTILVCWGSNRGVVEEALELIGAPDLAALHFSQVFPLHPASLNLLADRRIMVVENNATGQFSDLLALELGRPVDRRLLKATGEPFAVEEILAALKGELHE